MICSFCRTEFNCLGALNHHVKTAKYCLHIQKKINTSSSLKNCEFCGKMFTSNYTIKCHLNTCKKKIQKENCEIIEQYRKDIEEKDRKISELERKLDEMNQLNIKLQTENNIYSKDHELVARMAQQPKTTNNNNE